LDGKLEDSLISTIVEGNFQLPIAGTNPTGDIRSVYNNQSQEWDWSLVPFRQVTE
jgi:hypothetical protein